MNRNFSRPSRLSDKVCKYTALGCPVKNCSFAHSVQEFKSNRRNKVQYFNQLVSELVQSSDQCPYDVDCPGIYCPYDYDKYTVEWTDESLPDFNQPLVFKAK